MVLVQAKGLYLSQLLPEVRIVTLKAEKTQYSLWDLGMAKAILKILRGQVPQIDPSWLEQFSLETIADQYLSIMGIV